jgi:hypothetical protein
MIKRKIELGLCAALLLAAAMSLNAAEFKPQEIAEKAAAQLGGELQKKLMESMRKNGPAASIDVCASEAPAISARIEEELGVTIKRTSLRVRNPQNAPDALERQLLQTLAAAQQAGEKIPRETTPFPDSQRRFYKVIMMQKTCLACHGDPAAMSEDIPSEIAATYPDDQATGFKEGDLRGIISVNVK